MSTPFARATTEAAAQGLSPTSSHEAVADCPAEDHRERERENNQPHRVDRSGSFLVGTFADAPKRERPTSGHSRASSYPFMRHGRFPSSMVVTVQRATPPIQPAAPR